MNFFRVCLVLMLALVMAMAQQQQEGSNLRGVEKVDTAPAANTTVPADSKDGDDKLLTGGGYTLGAPACIFTGLFTPFCLFQRKWEQLTHKN